MTLPSSEEYHNAEDREGRLLELLTQRIDPGDSVLEAGCGSGRWVNRLARARGCRVLGVDVDGSGFDEGREEARRMGVGHAVEFLELDMVELPIVLDRKFDLALSLHSMHEYGRPHEVLRAIRQVLEPGGSILVLDYIKGSTAERIWSEDYYTPSELRSLLEGAGFEPRETLLPWGRELALIDALGR